MTVSDALLGSHCYCTVASAAQCCCGGGALAEFATLLFVIAVASLCACSVRFVDSTIGDFWVARARVSRLRSNQIAHEHHK